MIVVICVRTPWAILFTLQSLKRVTYLQYMSVYHDPWTTMWVPPGGNRVTITTPLR